MLLYLYHLHEHWAESITSTLQYTDSILEISQKSKLNQKMRWILCWIKLNSGAKLKYIYIYIINEKVDREKAKISFIHSSAIQNIWILVSLLFFTVIVIIIQSLYGNDAFPLTSFIFFNGILLQDGGKKRLRLKGRV